MLALSFPSFLLSHPYIVSAASPLIFSLKQGKGKGQKDFERITVLSMDLNKELNTKHPVFAFNWWHSNCSDGWTKPGLVFQIGIILVAYYPIEGKLSDYLKLPPGPFLYTLRVSLSCCALPPPLLLYLSPSSLSLLLLLVYSDSPGHHGNQDSKRLCLFCSLLVSLFENQCLAQSRYSINLYSMNEWTSFHTCPFPCDDGEENW